jgi:hypothetical protein
MSSATDDFYRRAGTALCLLSSAALGCARSNVATPPGRSQLLGEWVETFESRPGCSDQITIGSAPTGLTLASEDCNDGEPYECDPPRISGPVLTASCRVTSTGWRSSYRLKFTPSGELEGTVEVTGEGETHSYDVTWRRPQTLERARP